MNGQGRGRVLTFAVTGALLGGVGIGGCSKHRGPHVNAEPVEQPVVNTAPTDVTEPEPEPENVNEGPVEEPPNVNPGPQ